MALDRRDHPGNRPAQCFAEPRLTSHTDHPNDPHHHTGKWNPAPTRHDTRAVGLPTPSHRKGNGPPTPSADRQERSRLG
jgi:hypothetical protein